MIRTTWALALLALVAAAGSGCSDSTSTGTTNPTPITVTDTFTGTLSQNAGQTYQVTTLQAGTVTAALSTLTAPNTNTPPSVGMSLGTWNGSSCNVVIVNDNATVSSTVIGTVSAPGVLCVRIYDVGNITSFVNYTLNVNHP
jgi:hypothetical protein